MSPKVKNVQYLSVFARGDIATAVMSPRVPKQLANPHKYWIPFGDIIIYLCPHDKRLVFVFLHLIII